MAHPGSRFRARPRQAEFRLDRGRRGIAARPEARRCARNLHAAGVPRVRLCRCGASLRPGPTFTGSSWHHLVFFGLVWTRAFSATGNSGCCSTSWFLIATLILISRQTGDPESRFIAIMLFPLATAAFVSWGTAGSLRWLSWPCELRGRRASRADRHAVRIYRWMGLIAAVMLAQSTSFFIERYRQRIETGRGTGGGGRFRQTQIATMAHDIRSPVAAMSGFVNLLEDDRISVKGAERPARTNRLYRLEDGLMVSNVLDHYRRRRTTSSRRRRNWIPNQMLAEVAEDCGPQARRTAPGAAGRDHGGCRAANSIRRHLSAS